MSVKRTGWDVIPISNTYQQTYTGNGIGVAPQFIMVKNMGCDIHLYSETKIDDKWVADKADTFRINEEEDDYPELDKSYTGGRNYWLFGLLSEGVRTEWPTSFKPRGFPEDASPEIKAKKDYWDGDDHSHSWLTTSELKTKAAELLICSDNEAKDLCRYLTDLISGLPPTTDTKLQRIVFWFDN